MPGWLRTSIAVALVAASATAAANPVEIFGLGARWGGQAGAGIAAADDMGATWMNPAGLARNRGKHLTLGGQGAVSNLHAHDRRVSLSDPAGGVLGLVVPAPLGGALTDRVQIGLGMYVLPTGVARIVAHFPSEPIYPYYQGRTERIVVLPGVGVRLAESVDVGLSANILAGLTGGITAGEGATRALEARVDEKVPTIARLIAGASWSPSPAVRLGAVFRQRFELPFATQAATEVAGEPIDLDLEATGQFSPATVALGATWMAGPATVSLDVSYARWSTYDGPFVAVKSELPLVGPLAAELPVVPWNDTLGARLGVEGDVSSEVTLRGGYATETSPVPADQPGVTNLLDAPKHIVAVGLGLRSHRSGGKAVRIDLYAQAHLLPSRRLDKHLFTADETGEPFDGLRDEVTDDPGEPDTLGAQTSNPGYPSIDSGGQVFAGGMMITVEI